MFTISQKPLHYDRIEMPKITYAEIQIFCKRISSNYLASAFAFALLFSVPQILVNCIIIPLPRLIGFGVILFVWLVFIIPILAFIITLPIKPYMRISWFFLTSFLSFSISSIIQTGFLVFLDHYDAKQLGIIPTSIRNLIYGNMIFYFFGICIPLLEFSVLLCIRMITIYAQQHRKSDKSDDKLS